MMLAKISLPSGDLPNDPDLQPPPAEFHDDRETLTTVARQLLPRVRNLIRYLVHGDQDVDDIAQEALLAILRGLSSYRGEGSLESWADRIVARVTFAWLRQRRPRRTWSLDVEDDAADDDATWPDEHLRRRRLVHLLDQLPHEQRYALVLHHVLGLSVAEIAIETASKAETVRTRLRLGRHRLRQLAEPDSTHGDEAHE